MDRQFDVEAPNSVWVTDITYIKTHEGFSYLAVVIDLFSLRRGLVYAKQATNRFGIAGVTYGRLAAQANQQGLGAFRPRFTVHQY